MNYQEIKITGDTDLLTALSDKYPEMSKSSLRKWISHNRISFKGKPLVKANTSLKEGDTLKLYDKRKAADQKLHIVYSDSNIVVVDKPFGLLSVATHYENNITAHDLLKRNKAYKRVFPVHRLDRETSGVMVFALTEHAREHLQDQFQVHSIMREYHAIVEGVPQNKKGVWKHHLIEDANYKMHASQQGALSITHFETKLISGKHAYLICHLETGKKNQIRVAASMAGHPIIGDTKYGGSNSPINRLALHAHSLGFKHPVTGKEMAFFSSIPVAFTRLFPKEGTFFTQMKQKERA